MKSGKQKEREAREPAGVERQARIAALERKLAERDRSVASRDPSSAERDQAKRSATRAASSGARSSIPSEKVAPVTSSSGGQARRAPALRRRRARPRRRGRRGRASAASRSAVASRRRSSRTPPRREARPTGRSPPQPPGPVRRPPTPSRSSRPEPLAFSSRTSIVAMGFAPSAGRHAPAREVFRATKPRLSALDRRRRAPPRPTPGRRVTRPPVALTSRRPRAGRRPRTGPSGRGRPRREGRGSRASPRTPSRAPPAPGRRRRRRGPVHRVGLPVASAFAAPNASVARISAPFCSVTARRRRESDARQVGRRQRRKSDTCGREVDSSRSAKLDEARSRPGFRSARSPTVSPVSRERTTLLGPSRS